ncbi:MAG TPA: MFS transporter [Chitinophagaceae bacterium]|nr:MFS transporter [Chitinophagaceae bacterium]
MAAEKTTAFRGSVIKRFFIDTLTNIPSQPPATKLTMRIAISSFYFCMGFSFASWASRIPDIKTKLQLSEAQLGTILLALPLGQLLTMPISGRLVTKYGSRTIMSFAALLYAVELTNIGWAAQMWQLGLALFIFGVVGNMANISVNTQGVLAEKVYGRPIMTSFHGVWSIAGFTGALVGLLMMNLKLTPRQHFFIVAAFVFVIVFIARRYLIPGTTASTEKKRFFSKPEGVLVQLGVIAFCSMAAEGTMFDWSGVYFKEVVEAPRSLIILGYASFMIMMATGRFFGDKIIAGVGRKKLLQVSGILILTGLMISVLFPYIVTATLGFVIVGLGVSSIIPTVYSTAARATKIAPGMALASVSSIGFFGFLMGPPLIGYIAELANLRYSFAVVALFGLCITMIVTKLKVMD